MPYARGHVRHPNKDNLMALSDRRHRRMMQSLIAQSFPATWDSRTLNWVGPVKDQSSCGSCWDFSGTGVVEVAYNVAGVGGGPDKMVLSEQYTLDCGRSGGCGGDDNVTVLQEAKAGGLPMTSDYGPYQGHSGRCHFNQKMTSYKIDDWGFVDGQSGDGVTDTDLIKAAIMKFGCVGSAVAAGSSWDNYQAGQVHTGGSTGIDHDVILIGWNDTSTTVTAYLASDLVGVKANGWWWMRNSWSGQWGENGYMRIAYKADSIGTEAVWAVVNSQAPPIDYWI